MYIDCDSTEVHELFTLEFGSFTKWYIIFAERFEVDKIRL